MFYVFSIRKSGTVNRTTDHALYNSNLHSKWWTLIASPLEQRFPFHLTFSYTPLHFRLLLFHVYLYIFRCVTIYLYIIITLAFTLTLGFTLTLTSLISNAVMVKFAYTLLLRYINVQIYSCYPHRLLISLNHFPFGTLILAAGL